ncbi:putative Lovastatin nonaketide synthase [Glarea lozoyensis 74030]|uniref:Putative Lovastatin nonaketide synthase n=1 Tax=Glarea lozoyensis (strain ATCC 74030 / MF5533) TaxID=1104152 RepID=H0ESE3_GLAL7|nr:putative Lovastatin nonaketide synthase [Glarea lozoyensis 74030]
MKILEIGAGTGGLTAKVINSLKNEYGERLYHSYTFTDISSGFFAKAKERFKEHHSIEYKVLDISKDPIAQGFTPGEYDFILAANLNTPKVLHATPTLSETLANCRKLLKPSGKLFLQELSPDFEIISVTLDGSLGPSAEAVKNELESQGYTINHCIWGEEEIPTSQDLISQERYFGKDKASVDLLARAIGLRVSGFLMIDEKDVDITQNLAAAGVDSLVAIKLRNWWKQSLGVEVSVLELMKQGSILGLVELAIERLSEKYRSKKKSRMSTLLHDFLK